ncbi:MAG: 4-hydroxy-2-oxoheptanedioate aldolase [Candidatus Velthaea sp.]
MRENKLRRAMLAGDVSIGGWCSLGDPLAAEIMARAGYDWLVVDMEHGPLPLSAVPAICTAIRTTATTPIVRVPWNDSASIQTALDSGPFGALVPMVNTIEDARAVVSDTRFSPLGDRSRGGVRASTAFECDGGTYFARANEETIVMVQIESKEAMAAAREMAELDGIDVLFVGPNDLAASYKVPWPGIWDDLKGAYGDALRALPAIARAAGKAAGILANSPAMGKRCIDMGYTVVGIAADTNLLIAGAARELASLKDLRAK